MGQRRCYTYQLVADEDFDTPIRGATIVLDRSRIHLALALGGFFFAAAAPASAAIISLNADGTGDYPDIQSAIDAANQSDIIELEDGVYTGPGNRDLDFADKTLRLRSRNNLPEECIIDCEYLGRGAYLPSGQTVDTEIRGITIYRGNADLATEQPGLGGGVLMGGGDPLIIDCIFRECITSDRGGALAITGGGFGDVLDTQFIGNETVAPDEGRQRGDLPGGGAVFIEASTTFFIDCHFQGNRATVGDGGAILATSGIPQFLNCSLEGNTSAGDGGAIACRSPSFAAINFTVLRENQAERGGAIAVASGASPTITDCLLERNEAERTGGVYCGPGTSFTISGCRFRDNRASTDGAGGLELDHGTVTVTGCTFDGNESLSAEAGGILIRGGEPTLEESDLRGNRGDNATAGGLAILEGSRATLRDLLITGNLGAPGGFLCDSASPGLVRATVAANLSSIPGVAGGMHVRDSDALVEQSIFWGNCSGGMPSDLDVTGSTGSVFSCVTVQEEGFVGAADVSTLDTSFADPLFCDAAPCLDAPTESGDFTLAAGSPCLPAASPCGSLMGARGEGCDKPNPVHSVTWGSLKHRFGKTSTSERGDQTPSK